MTKTVKTFTATIHVGLKNRDTGKVLSFAKAEREIQKHVDEVSLCVTVTRTQYIYKDGREPGILVGLINYPRFPSTAKQIITNAVALAKRLKRLAKQYKVSIVFPDKTVMLSTEPAAALCVAKGVR